MKNQLPPNEVITEDINESKTNTHRDHEQSDIIEVGSNYEPEEKNDDETLNHIKMLVIRQKSSSITKLDRKKASH